MAVPFFLLALLVELIIDRRRGAGLYRSNDAINSLSAGTLSTTIGYFTRLLPLVAWGFVLENFALMDMPLGWFDASSRGIALWVTAALAWDFCYYWFHRFSHEISVLWAAHAVHHQSEDYNLSTALRQTSTGFLFGWIFYVPLFVIGFPLEVLVTVNAVSLIYQFWVHTQFVRRMGVLDRILVTPSNHRVHHAQNERYIDKNYGGILILWDRLFGTFEDERDDEPVIFGVRKPLANWNPFWANRRSTTTCFSMRGMRDDGATSWVSGSGEQGGGRLTWKSDFPGGGWTSPRSKNSIRRFPARCSVTCLHSSASRSRQHSGSQSCSPHRAQRRSCCRACCCGRYCIRSDS